MHSQYVVLTRAYFVILTWSVTQTISEGDTKTIGTNRLASFPDLPASFGTRSEAEGLVSQVT